MKKTIGVLFVLVLCAGCAFVSKNLNDEEAEVLRLQMTKEQLISKMGDPSETRTITSEGETYEIMRYPFERKFKGKYNALDMTYYDVYLLDGKIVRWEMVRLYAQPGYEMKPLKPESPVKTFTLFQVGE